MNDRDVLWTGGWDSTYRVLMLALAEGAHVRPHYLIDPDRKSTEYELWAIESIRQAAAARGAAIDPLRTASINDVPLSAEAAAAHESLAREFKIGPQYLWLSEYARQRGIEALELCIHVDDKAFAAVEAREQRGLEGELDLFRPFDFPILHTSKLEMWKDARARGFDDLMERTWFCHLPTRSGQPCGFCSPCLWTAGEGLAHRLTRVARLRAHLDRAVARIPSYRIRHAIRSGVRAVG